MKYMNVYKDQIGEFRLSPSFDSEDEADYYGQQAEQGPNPVECILQFVVIISSTSGEPAVYKTKRGIQ